MNSNPTIIPQPEPSLPKQARLIKFLKGSTFAVICILLILLTNLRHAVSVYFYLTGSGPNSDSFGTAYIVGMMLAFDLAVIAFSVNGNKSAAKVFALSTGLINLFYFYTKIGLPESLLNPGCSMCDPAYIHWMRYAPAVLFSSMVGYAIYYFTEIFIGNIEWEGVLNSIRAERDDWQQKYLNLNQKKQEDMELLKTQLSQQTELTLQLINWIAEEGNYDAAKVNTLQKRRSRARERIANGSSEEEKLKAKLEILVLDHHLENRDSQELVLFNGQG